MRNSLKLAAVLVAVTATSASAQGRGRNVDGVPPGMRPPAGMCRVWVNGVPPGQQSGVTDCATAQAQAQGRANSRVLYGSNTRSSRDLNREYTRRRQLADGSWVLDRFRRDASGNVTLISSRPLNTNGNGTWNHKRGDDNEQEDINKAQRKAEKKEWKEQRKEEKRMLKADHKRDKEEMKDDDNDEHGDHGDHGHRGGNGKGKH